MVWDLLDQRKLIYVFARCPVTGPVMKSPPIVTGPMPEEPESNNPKANTRLPPAICVESKVFADQKSEGHEQPQSPSQCQ